MSKIFNTKADYETALAAATTDAEKMDVRLKYAGQIKDEIEEANKKGESETVTRLRLEAAELKAEMANNKAENIEKEVERVKADQGKTNKSAESTISLITKELVNSKSTGLNIDKDFDIKKKAVGDITSGTSFSGTTNKSLEESGLTELLDAPLDILNVITVKTISKPTVKWREKRNREGGATAVAEAGAFPAADFEAVEASITVQKIAAKIGVTEEALEDVDYAEAEIRSEIGWTIGDVLETAAYAGTGTGSAMKGLGHADYCTTFSAPTSMALNIVTPNLWDVAEAMITQSKLNKARPDVWLVNPGDFAKLMVTKGKNENYLYHPLYNAANKTFNGLKIVEWYYMPAGTTMIIDSRRTEYLSMRKINIKKGQENDDLSTDMYTFVASIRGNFRVKANYVGGNIKAVISTAITALTKA